MKSVILDVREKDEFDAEQIVGSIHCPLSQFHELAPAVLRALVGQDVSVMCRSGARAKLAMDEITKLGFSEKVKATIFLGGIVEWKKQGHPVVTSRKYHLPIIRQVQIVAGLSVLGFSLASVYLNPHFVWGAVFFGAGLSIAGLTGFCGMAHLLSWAPWNRTESLVKEELCQASPTSGCEK